MPLLRDPASAAIQNRMHGRYKCMCIQRTASKAVTGAGLPDSRAPLFSHFVSDTQTYPDKRMDRGVEHVAIESLQQPYRLEYFSGCILKPAACKCRPMGRVATWS